MSIEKLKESIRGIRMSIVIIPTKEILFDYLSNSDYCTVFSLDEQSSIEKVLGLITYEDIALDYLEHYANNLHRALSKVSKEEADIYKEAVKFLGKNLYRTLKNLSLYKNNRLVYELVGVRNKDLVLKLVDPDDYDVL